MHPTEKFRFDSFYQKHLTALKLHGHADKTIEAYARGVRRLADRLDRCPTDVTKDELNTHFAKLLETHAWATIKLDRNGIRFFYENVLDKKLPWIDLIKAPKTQRLPDVLTHTEIASFIQTTRRFDYRCFWFVTYSLGLRLGESLNLHIGDIDAERRHVHVRHGKGAKDRFVILPTTTLAVLRKLWCLHRHPRLLFPGRPAPDRTPAPKIMDRGNTLPIADFLWHIALHVLPKALQRVRSYGFLHGNARRLLALLQLALRVLLPDSPDQKPQPYLCSGCGAPMHVGLYLPPLRMSG